MNKNKIGAFIVLQIRLKMQNYLPSFSGHKGRMEKAPHILCFYFSSYETTLDKNTDENWKKVCKEIKHGYNQKYQNNLYIKSNNTIRDLESTQNNI